MKVIYSVAALLTVASLSCGAERILGGRLLTIATVNPTSGPTTGGTVITVTGTGFPSNVQSVTFGGVPGTAISVTGDSLATVTTPAHAAGAVPVTVKLTTGDSASIPNAFTYFNPDPTLTSISPTNGPIAGGTAFTLTGTGFLTGATVTFGGTAATSVVVASATSVTGTTPAHAAGAVNVVVTNTDAKLATLVAGYTYNAPPSAPTITNIAPTSGSTAGGTSFTITGTAFVTGATVSFGGTAATGVSVASATSITGTTPAHAAGAVNVVVTNPDAQFATLASGFTYVVPGGAPTIADLSRTAGSAAGGATVVITGTNFVSGTTVTFGGTASSSVTVNSTTQLTVIVPAHAVGVVDVAVTSSGQTVTQNNGFEYLPAPTTTYFSQTFENNTLSPLVADLSPGGSLAVSTDFAFQGTRSAKSTQLATSSGGAGAALAFNFGGSTPPNPPASDPNGVYFRWYLYVPTASVDLLQVTGAQMKLHLYRFLAGSGQPGWLMCGIGASFRGRTFSCFIDNGLFPIAGGETNYQMGDGVWLEIQVWQKRVGGQGRSRGWVNGKPIFDVTSNVMGDDTTNPTWTRFGAVFVVSLNGTINAYVDNVAGANGFIDP